MRALKGAGDAFGRMGAAHFYNRCILFPRDLLGAVRWSLLLLAAIEITLPEILCYDEDEE